MNNENKPELRDTSRALSTRLSVGQWARQETTSLFVDVVAHFLLSCRSVHTRRNYARDIGAFVDFAASVAAPIVDIHDVTEKLVLLWKEHLQQHHTRYEKARRRIVQTSVARRLSALSSLLDFAVKRSLLEKNPAKLVSRPKVVRESRTNALTAAEVGLLLELARSEAQALSPEEGRFYRSAHLRYTVLATLLSVGMRVDELCELRIGDLEITPQFARLHMTAKGGETHSPIVHPKTATMLQDYIQRFRAGAKPGDFLFLRAQQVKKEVKLTQTAVYQMIQELALRAGIDKKLSPHSCRATLATILHNKGVPVGQIQDLLNHKQITTTAIYIKKAEELEQSAAMKVDVFALADGRKGQG